MTRPGVKIKNTYVCPKCEEGVTADEKPTHCPACRAKFPAPGYAGFEDPVTITEQQERIKDEAAHMAFVVDLPVDIANNIMNDALNIIQTIPVKKVKVSDIRTMMRMAIQIGEVARKYEEFLLAGGTHTPDLFIKVGEDDESTTNRDGAQASAPLPTPLFPPVE